MAKLEKIIMANVGKAQVNFLLTKNILLGKWFLKHFFLIILMVP